MNTEQSTSTDEKTSPISSLELWLYGVLFGWPLAMPLLAYIVLGNELSYCFPFGCSLLVPIVVVIALKNYAVARHFLRGLVAVLLITTLLAGGFYHCAVLASDGSLKKTMARLYSTYVHVEPPISRVNAASTVLAAVTFSLHHPDQDWRIALQPVVCYAYTASPYLTLLLLMTPPSLALPVFWLLVVLSILYVVLPSRAWKRMKDAVLRR